MDDLERQRQAVQITRQCQRNWNLDKIISRDHIDHWIHLATHAPSKQDEITFQLCVITNHDILKEIYQNHAWGYHWSGNNTALRNTQMGANCLFIWGHHNPSDIKGDHHGILEHSEIVENDFDLRQLENVERSIGMSSGIVSFSAAMLGYKTGFCRNFFYDAQSTKSKWKQLLGYDKDSDFFPKVGLGIGYPDSELEYYQTKDLEYLVADPRETDLESKGCLEDYNGIIKKINDREIFNFGPISTDPSTKQPVVKQVLFKIID
jgi:hypothetical protein